MTGDCGLRNNHSFYDIKTLNYDMPPGLCRAFPLKFPTCHALARATGPVIWVLFNFLILSSFCRKWHRSWIRQNLMASHLSSLSGSLNLKIWRLAILAQHETQNKNTAFKTKTQLVKIRFAGIFPKEATHPGRGLVSFILAKL